MLRFLCLSLLLVAVLGNIKLNRGNHETKKAFDAALLEMWQDGSYDDLYRTWFNESPERFTDCVENSASLYYPAAVTNRGLLDDTLDTGTIRMGYFGPLAVLPGFDVQNGQVVSGFYPSLAEDIVSRIATFYEIPSISITWVEITTISDFYPDHVSGVYDVVFMNLFKNTMWSAPVAPRDEIWEFSCGLLTAEPLRFYVCPSAVTKGLDITSAETIDSSITTVQYIAGGAQQAAAEANFPTSIRSAAADLTALFTACEDGTADVIVELPNRITNSVQDVVVDSQPIGTYHNTGAAFRLDH